MRLGEGGPLTLSPDGKWIISDIPGTPERLVLLPTGAGTSRAVGASNLELYEDARWLPDGKTIAFSAKEPGHDYRTYLQEIDGRSPKPITPEGAREHLVSPDGKEILAVDSQRRWSIYPVQGGEPHAVAGIEPGEEAVQWSSDGRSLYIAKYGPAPLKVYKLNLATHQRQIWKEISPSGHPGVLGVGPVRITPDGGAYAYSYIEDLSDLYLVEALK